MPIKGGAPLYRNAEAYPASPEQEGLWIEYSLAPSAVDYNECLTLDITGPLDHKALQNALAVTVTRHAPLRTRFRIIDGRLTQIVEQRRAMAPVTDDCTESEIDARVLDLLAQPFDLAKAWPWRWALLRIAPDRQILIVVIHHIICDGWSRRVFLDEMARNYAAFREGASPGATCEQMPDYSYGDYVQDRIAVLDERRRADLVQYWRKTLNETKPQTMPRGSQGTSSRVGTSYHEFEAAFTAELAAHARANACSPFVVVLALIQRLLFEQFGIDDVIIGTDFAGRSDPRLESLIGLFARQVPLRLRTIRGDSFQDLLQRAQGVVIEAIAVSELGFAEISSCMRENSAGSALFALKVVLEQGFRPQFEWPQLLVSYRVEPIAAAKFPLLLNFALDDGHLVCRSEFDPSRIDPDFARRLAVSLPIIAAREFDGASRSSRKLPGREPDARPSDPARQFQRRAVALSDTATLLRNDDSSIPGFVSSFRPANPHADPASLFADNRDLVHGGLRTDGAVLVRDLVITAPTELEAVAQALFGSVLAYTERTSPRSTVGGRIYTSTDYPSEETLPLHNENSYAASWPRWIAFFCFTPPGEGGCTPLADIGDICARLPAELRATFERRGLQYVRKFGGPLGLSAAAAFGTADLSSIERRLQSAGYSVQLVGRGHLITRRCAAAVRLHPDTGTAVWFNHAHFFGTTEAQLTRKYSLSREDLPTRVLHADGQEIAPHFLATLNDAYAAAERRFAWRSGDLLLLDNMRIAHGRDAFRPPRRIWVAMSEEIHDTRQD
ncbi:alpha-ketoglutarate-dependent taurine dioxygenase [Bradyrhizobium sp. GM5.1]